ncbi:hydantoinase/oxoprolinase family protein [Mesorhizobium sp. M0317]|uniref:hydantoinase/oxoprolinase family protein n=1 Tax=Mesorhizobium sp. M0317 TaxID=2956935 RepID=UPI00333C2BBC
MISGVLRIGVDIGGTFTDLVLTDREGSTHAFKTPTTPDDPAQGVLDALEKAAGALGVDTRVLLSQCSHFVHGTTIATNTVLEGKGAKVGLLTTHGFRDTLEIRRGWRANMWDHRSPWPEVMVPRYLRFSVYERMDKYGSPVTALHTEAVAEAVGVFKCESVESIAICFLNSFLNDAHERQCEEWIRAAWPEAWVCRSSQIAPIVGEYERTSTTVVNAYVAPRVVPYLRELDQRLKSLGLKNSLLLIQSNGGAVSVEQVGLRPISLLLSGPAAGVGALRFFAEVCGSRDLISMEIGGTSCDVTMVRGGRVAETDRLSVEGYDVVMPAAEIHTIGMGGGTIAGVDVGGMLRVGPKGAGARPGPACYGLGGTRPTITDAQVVLGRLRSGRYADGLIDLDIDLATRAIRDHVARPLGIDVVEAAAGIIRMADQSILHALERMSSERGCDPGTFTLVAGGGAGALHATSVARALGCDSVFVPRLAGVFCAFGMCNTDIRHDYLHFFRRSLGAASAQELGSAFDALENSAEEALRQAGFNLSDSSFERLVDIKYNGQQWPVTIPITEVWHDIAAVRERFKGELARLYGYVVPDGEIVINALRLVATGRLPHVEANKVDSSRAVATPLECRAVYIEDAREVREVAVFDGADLFPGYRIPGPALIDEATTTILLNPGDVAEVDAYGNYLITLGEVGEKHVV